MRVLGVVIAAAAFMGLAGAAYAQNEKPVPRYGEQDKDKTAQEIAGQKAAERAYQSSLGNIPDKGPVDPWGSVRSDGPAKPAAKAAKVRAKPLVP